MSSQTSTDTTSSQTNNPPDWALPLFQTAAGDALSLYNSGAGGKIWKGSTIADLSGLTKTGIGNLFNAGKGWDTSATRSYLTPMAQGDYLSGNPYYMQQLQEDTQKQNDLLKSAISGQGRYGSDYMGTTLAENTRRNMLEGLNYNYGLERGYQQDAINALYGMDQQNFLNRLQGSQAQLAASGILDNQAQSKLSDRVNQFYAKQNAPWTQLSKLLAAATGSAGPYGTMTGQSTSDTSSSNPMAAVSAIGGLMGGK